MLYYYVEYVGLHFIVPLFLSTGFSVSLHLDSYILLIYPEYWLYTDEIATFIIWKHGYRKGTHQRNVDSYVKFYIWLYSIIISYTQTAFLLQNVNFVLYHGSATGCHFYIFAFGFALQIFLSSSHFPHKHYV